jgi:uncharacterized protein YjbI with pentapeptide repeats
MPFRTLKPFQLGLLFRTVERQRSIYSCFSVLAMTSRSGSPTLKSEPSLWTSLAQHAPDFVEPGVIKWQPEFLVFGHAYPHADDRGRGAVGVQFAGVKKWFPVSGPRTHPHALDPAPFERIRLDWRHAYGGPDFPGNPAGMGRVKDGQGNIALPHFEADAEPWRADAEATTPVGFGPLDVMHPDRQKLVGTYDDRWLKAEAPGMAVDSDWHFFQVAPPDQRLDEELRGDEPYDLAGMHPRERLLQGRLPGIRPRLFVERRHEGILEEIRCRLRTVVFLPDADAVIQIWQGTAKVADEDASELTHVLAGFETVAAPRPEAHYAAVMARRLDERDGMLAMLKDDDLLPEGMTFEPLAGDVDLNRTAPPDSFRGRREAKNLRLIEAARAEAASYGLDPDVHAPRLPQPREPIPPPHQLGEYLRALDRQAQEQIEAADERKRRMLETTAAEFAARGESFDNVLRELASGPTGPPRPQAPELIAALDQVRAGLLEDRTDVEELATMAGDTTLHERWRSADRSAQQIYEQSAHLQNPAPRAEGPKAEEQQRWVAERVAKGEPLSGVDLTGADLRGIDLRGANLDGALMESACLDGVDLRGASARGAVLAHATLEKARADGCDFSGANLGKARFAAASAIQARFDGAILWETDFTGAALRGARLAGAQALHVKLAGADLSESVLDDVLLYQTDLTGTRFVKASINGTQFLENRLDGADFTGARGRRALFLKAQGEGLKFDDADLGESTFVQEPKLPGASMRGARLSKVFLHGADLTGADLARANLDGAELGGSTLKGANLRGATAREAGLRFADLTGARVVGADLRGALLSNATLHGARLDRSSVFMADLARIRVDTDTTFEGVNFGRARLYPRWEPPQT